MTFQGFKVNSVGNATLQIIENKLKVSNIGNSGLDGVTIKTEDVFTINDIKEYIT
jgi:hypothetical protein